MRRPSRLLRELTLDGTFQRDVLRDGVIRFTADGAGFVVRRLVPGVLYVTAWGYDRGQFGQAILDEFRAEMGRFKAIDLFLDTRDVVNTSMEVSDAWTAFFAQHQNELRRVGVLVTSRYFHMTVEVAKHFSRTGELMRTYNDPAAFVAAIGKRVPGFASLPGRE